MLMSIYAFGLITVWADLVFDITDMIKNAKRKEPDRCGRALVVEVGGIEPPSNGLSQEYATSLFGN